MEFVRASRLYDVGRRERVAHEWSAKGGVGPAEDGDEQAVRNLPAGESGGR